MDRKERERERDSKWALRVILLPSLQNTIVMKIENVRHGNLIKL
jgi:hypothetical protein